MDVEQVPIGAYPHTFSILNNKKQGRRDNGHIHVPRSQRIGCVRSGRDKQRRAPLPFQHKTTAVNNSDG